MARSKSYVSRIFLLVEMLIFLGVYFLGIDGLQKLSMLRDENIKLEQEVATLNNEIATLEHEIVAWNTDPFYKEKVAREQLQMAREQDEILFINNERETQ